ncbi:5'-nucleotidase C-terminal domain-containing protein [Oceanibaculum pacificum]|uniref:Bifunctional metallophosphatase/5'-nucleotidase n=1 Tax=Oceanibaculum pacificum TaxID=580166 RepID=A0A154W8R3_9PROT|nr:5'-nucleotidase C-terminal domain-containing protein [Oceanibaculum pacificum]KZD09875.1 bifunctional metallophosphatase/5'-nucleotidase [Oceanibaculum pacificum]
MAYTLQILHASDLEGGVEAISRAPNFAAIVDYLEDTYANTIVLSAGDNFIPGPFFNAAADSSIAATLNAVFTQLYGQSFESLSAGSGRLDIAIMNAIGFDASALGNHDFDAGTDGLLSVISPSLGETTADTGWLGTMFPYLSANLDFSANSSLNALYTDELLANTDFQSLNADGELVTGAPKLAASTIIERDGEQIGVIGATTQVLASISSPGNVEVLSGGVDDMEALAEIIQPEIDKLLDAGVNKIVLVSHLQQIALEKALAGLLSGVDVIIAGGSDTLLADAEDVERGLQDGDTPAETYPFLTTNADGDPVAIVSTDGEYSYVGRLVVTFDDDGVLDTSSLDEAVSGAFAATEEQVEALYGSGDAFADGSKGDLVSELTGAVESIVSAQDGNIFGATEVYLNGVRNSVRSEETNLGNLTADANLFVAQELDDTVLVSVKNGGGIRAAIGQITETSPGVFEPAPPQANELSGKEEGEVSQLDILNSLRFNNALSLVTVTADQLKQIAEHTVAASGGSATPGQFGQWGGVRFSFDTTQAAGSRIQNMAIVDDNGFIADVIVQDGELVGDAGRAIRIVTLSFLAEGGDNYPIDDFIAANPDFANRVDLADAMTDAGAATFADPGTEQDALAEYMAAQYSDTPFAEADTAASEDRRIQNLEFRDDAVLVDVREAGDDGEAIEGGDFADSIRGGAGDDTITGGAGNDTIEAGDGFDLIDLTDDTGETYVNGNRNGDTILGGTANEELHAGKGHDSVDGGAGDDLIWGGLGRDTLTGGDGADTFFFEDTNNEDVVTDFEAGVDVLSFTANINGSGVASAADLLDLAVASGGNVVIDFGGGNSITLQGVALADLSVADFAVA